MRCVKGAIYDVVVDMREDSPTYLRWFGAELSEDNGLMMYVPKGFAHGYQALSDGASGVLHGERVLRASGPKAVFASTIPSSRSHGRARFPKYRQGQGWPLLAP